MLKCYNIMVTGRVQDIGRKRDGGNDILGQILTNTSELPEIKTVLNSYVIDQREHNQWMKEHNQRLENILDKLAEK